MDLATMAKLIEAEAGTLPYPGKMAVAQCIEDNAGRAEAFTAPASGYSQESFRAARLAKLKHIKRIQGTELLQFRSFGKYSDGSGNPDIKKIRTGAGAVPWELVYLGEDHKDTRWGQFYFGRFVTMTGFKMLLIAGHGRNVDGSWDPGACGCGYQEASLTRELVPLIKAAADAAGIPCDVAADRNYYSFFKHGGWMDFRHYNYVLEVHFNASGERTEIPDHKLKGTMLYIDKSETGHTVEDAILQNLIALGSRMAWDGVVVTQRQAEYCNGLEVQNAVRRQGVSHAVLETCFITDIDDMTWYEAHKTEIAAAVVAGIVRGFRLGDQLGNTAYCGTGVATARARETMNVRDGASIDSKAIGLVRTGQEVEVMEFYSSGWMKIVWPGAAIGYAYTSNVCGKYYDVT